MLLEGVGSSASHAHREANGIVRLNHLGRHWIVSNGYGKRVGVTHAPKAFSTRVRGPEDHNMLVLQRDGEIVCDLPPALLLQRGRHGSLLYATSAVIGYGGTTWLRTMIVLANRYVLVIDRVQLIDEGLEQAHVQWNALGRADPRPNGIRLEQQGVSGRGQRIGLAC